MSNGAGTEQGPSMSRRDGGDGGDAGWRDPQGRQADSAAPAAGQLHAPDPPEHSVRPEAMAYQRPRAREDVMAARKRRRRWVRVRHGLVFLLIVLIVLGGAGYATAYYQGWLGKQPVPHACKPVKPLPNVPARLVSLNVLNASSRVGIAQSVAATLQRRGFRIISTGDDPQGATVPGPAQVRYGAIGAAIAQTVARQVPGATLHEDGRTNPSVDLVIGNTYKHLVQTAPPSPHSFTLNVYNTTYRSGLAGKIGRKMKARGFRIGTADNDPQRSFVTGVAVLRYGPNGVDSVRRVQLQVRGATLLKDNRKDRSVDLVLGAKFAGLVPVAKATAPPVPRVTIKPPGGASCAKR